MVFLMAFEMASAYVLWPKKYNMSTEAIIMAIGFAMFLPAMAEMQWLKLLF